MPLNAQPPDTRAILAAFEQRPDGTWLCVAPITIATSDGPVEIRAGAVFAYGRRLGLLDVAEYLEQLGASFGS